MPFFNFEQTEVFSKPSIKPKTNTPRLYINYVHIYTLKFEVMDNQKILINWYKIFS